MIYFLIVLLLILISYVITDSGNEFASSKLFMFFSFVCILFLYIFKDNSIFPDLDNYEILFQNSRLVSWDRVSELQNYLITDKYEIGWCCYTKFFSSISNDFSLIISATAFIYLFCFWLLIKRYSKYLLFAVVLFVILRFYNSCFILRQNTAVAICVLSIPYIENRKPIKFALTIIFASLFHQSAMIFSIMYFLYNVSITKKYIISVVIITLALYLGVLTILNNIVQYIEYYQSYIVENRTEQGSNYTAGFLSLISVCFLFLVYKNKTLDKRTTLFIHALVISSIINVIKVGMPGTVGRLALYFTAFQVIIIPNACKTITNSSYRIMAVLFFFVLYFVLFYSTFNYGFEIKI